MTVDYNHGSSKGRGLHKQTGLTEHKRLASLLEKGLAATHFEPQQGLYYKYCTVSTYTLDHHSADCISDAPHDIN